MTHNLFFYLFLCIAFFSIGELLAVLTKAKVSAVFVSLLLFLICFMTGLIPKDIIKQAELAGLAKWAVMFIVFSMGTTIDLRSFMAEWRTVLTACVAMCVVMVAGCIAIPLIGYNEAIVAIPILNGGIVATQIMTAAASEHGYALAAALGTALFAIQKFLGTPVASYFAMREARILMEEYHRTGKILRSKGEQEAPATPKPTFYDKHKRYFGNFTLLAITAFFCWIGFLLGKATGLAPTIWALILGTVVSTTGCLPKNVLKQANSSGIFNVAVFATIIPSLANVRPNDLWIMGVAIVILFVLSFVLLFVAFYILPLWRIIGSKNLACGVSMGQFLGFPATYLIVNEVANAAAQNETEKQIISDHLMSKYLIGGFATVSSISIIIAGIFATFIS